MENYPSVLLQQPAPFIKLEIKSELENTPVHENLTKHVHQFNIAGKVWDNSIIKNRLSNAKYIIEIVKESQNKSQLPDNSSSEEHSLLSPFNSDSDLFPNGILSRKWFEKYYREIPFAFIKTLKLSKDPSDDAQLIIDINALKSYYHTCNVKFVVILVSGSEAELESSVEGIDARVNTIRNSTNLPRLTGLLYLQNVPETLSRDTELVVTTLLSNLKNSGTEFYSNIEHKIKQRNKKYYSCPSTQDIDTDIEITPKALETRNLVKQAIINQFASPHNLESSIKLLELSYQFLIDILRDNFSAKIQDGSKISAHDTVIFSQYRQLTDIIAFHIVRGYFSLKEPILALKKHKTHVANVFSIVWVDSLHTYNCNWVSIQYEWLAELMELLPESILSNLGGLASKNLPKNSPKTIPYLGGLKFVGSFTYDVITTSSLAYLRAVDYLRKSSQEVLPQSQSSPYDYLYKNTSPGQIKNHIIELLELSANSLVSSSFTEGVTSNKSSLESFVSYINWQVGEEYFYMEDEASLKTAVEFYESSLAKMEIAKWSELSSTIIQRLLLCYAKLGDSRNELYNILKLSTVTNFAVLPQFSKNEQLFVDDSLTNISLDCDQTNVGQLIDVHALIISKDNEEAFIYDECQTQLLLRSNINVDLLKDILPSGSLVRVVIEELAIEIYRLDGKASSKRSIVLTHGETLDTGSFVSQVDVDQKDFNNHTGMANLDLSNSRTGLVKVITFEQRFQKTGLYEIQAIKAKVAIEMEWNKKRYSLRKTELLQLGENPFSASSHHNTYYSIIPGTVPTSLKDLKKNSSRVNTANSRVIRISPLKPDITLSIEGNGLPASLVLGEKVSIPIRITYKHPQNQHLKYNKLALSSSVKVNWEKEDSDLDIVTQVSWDDLKDDEALDLTPLVEDESKVHTLNISLRNTPNGNAQQARALVGIDLKSLVAEENGQDSEEDENDSVAIYDTASYEIPLLTKPFQSDCIICPRHRSEKVYIPSPFIVSSETPETNTNMPIVTRLWLVQFNLNITEDIEIVSSEVVVKAKNDELIVESEGTPELVGTRARQFITTRSRNGFSHRNVPVTTSVTAQWKRIGSEIVNEYTTEEWDIVLPLSDPRVLLDVEAGEKQGEAKLTYTLENPTSRIFTFTTQMDDVEFGWTFDDDRNIVPLRQPSFPVLPFSRHVMEFYGHYESEDALVKLPNLKVYDVQYKVGLASLSINEDIISRDGQLVWKRN